MRRLFSNMCVQKFFFVPTTNLTDVYFRIDDNMDETLTHVEGARSSLLKHLNRISSNRGLLIKIFAILIFFLMLFIFFLA